MRPIPGSPIAPTKKSRKAKAAAKKPTANRRQSCANGVKRGPLPDFVPPTLATLVDNPPSGGQSLREIR